MKNELSTATRLELGILAATLSVLFSATSCKSPLIAGYEVLLLPVATNQYQVGAQWISRIGTSGAPVAPTALAPGLNQYLIDRTNDASLNLSVPLIKWISGGLNLGNKEVTIGQLTNLSHITISDAKDITVPVLWEDVVVSNFTFQIKKAVDPSLNVTAALSNAFAGVVGNLQLSVSNQSDGTRFLQSDHPLVVAIRVVIPVQGFTDVRSPLSLTDNAVGQSQSGQLGYAVSLQSTVDPVARKATLHIDNPSIPEFVGTNQTFTGSDPWICPARHVINGADLKTRSVDYVWDKLSIQWNTDLSKCWLEFTRQYTKFVPTKSGIAGTQ